MTTQPITSVTTAEVMGTVATIQVISNAPIEAQAEVDAAIKAFVAAMRADQAVFTTYDESSVIRKIARGEMSLADAPQDVRDVEIACRLAKAATLGRFDAWLRGWFDPTGYVKGWSTERAFHQYLEPLLRSDATPEVIAVGVNVGGDMQLATRPGADFSWKIGVADPLDASKLVARLDLRNGAVATSGPAERGRHIIDPSNLTPVANDVASATVIAENLTYADVWATTAVVAGFDDLSWITTADTRSGLVVSNSGETRRWAGPTELSFG